MSPRTPEEPFGARSVLEPPQELLLLLSMLLSMLLLWGRLRRPGPRFLAPGPVLVLVPGQRRGRWSLPLQGAGRRIWAVSASER